MIEIDLLYEMSMKIISSEHHFSSQKSDQEVAGLEKEAASSSGGTNDGMLHIIEGLTRENERKKKRERAFQRLNSENLRIREENVKLKERVLGLTAIMDQDNRVNKKRIEGLTLKVSNAEVEVNKAAKEMKVFNNPRSAIPMMKNMAEKLEKVVVDLARPVLDQGDVRAIFVERSPMTSETHAHSMMKRRRVQSSIDSLAKATSSSSSPAAMKIPINREARESVSGMRSDVRHGGNARKTKMASSLMDD